jgi:DNA helicase-2/ATP-dependent DNA helicase PcrA
MHSAKGLEFKYVFIAGLEEGMLPHSRSMLSPDEMEEERRLMYVGITRAKEKVYLLFTRERNIFGSTQVNAPSRFLDDIPENLIEAHSVERKTRIVERGTHNVERKTWNVEREGNVPRSTVHVPRFSDGDRVHHEMFGDGLIVASQGDIITVAFSKVGLKKLSASVAPLRKI